MTWSSSGNPPLHSPSFCTLTIRYSRLSRTLRSLNLPGALEALEKPIGLPPSLLKKAEEVRLESGPEKIESSIEAVQRLAQQDLNILNEVSRSLNLAERSAPDLTIRRH